LSSATNSPSITLSSGRDWFEIDSVAAPRRIRCV
jgi:hypothetical protein